MSQMQSPARQTYAPGTFCWADLGTPDAEAAKKFYTALFGWSAVDMPMGDGAFYSMLRKDGRDAAGLYRRPAAEGPAGWLGYLSVESADAAAARARELGATVSVEPVDVFTSGRMALIRDPSGAAVGLWEPRDHTGSGLLDQPGGLCWFELMSHDPDRARDFFAALFDWGAQRMQVQETDYTVLLRGETPAAGVMQMPAESADAPSFWMAYFRVEDVDRTAARAWELGGRVVAPPADVPDIGRFALLRDPQGAVFGVLAAPAAAG